MYKSRPTTRIYFYICCLIIVVVVCSAIVIVADHSYNHLIEGVAVDKMIYPPVGRQIVPQYIVVVENNGKTDYWNVSESYYDSVHVGSYVKK